MNKLTFYYHSIWKLLGATLIGFCINACSNDNVNLKDDNDNSRGSLSLKLVTDKSVIESTAPNSRDLSDDINPLEKLNSLTVSDLSVSIKSVNGTYSQKWASFDDFPTDLSLSPDNYVLSASYGDKSKEGFDTPYLYGETTFEIKKDEVTTVNLTAKLQHSVVGILFTEDFLNYFSNYEVIVTTALGNEFIIDKEENRHPYVTPGSTTVTANLTSPTGSVSTYKIAEFETKSATHHQLMLDVNMSQSAVELDVSFDDSFDREDMSIDLTEFFFSEVSPIITTSGFTPGQEMFVHKTTWKGTGNNDYWFNIVVSNGIKTAVMVIESSNGTRRNYNLCNLAVAESLVDMGILSYGIAEGSRYAKINLTDWVENLVGNYEGPDTQTSKISLDLTDKAGLSNQDEDISFIITLEP